MPFEISTPKIKGRPGRPLKAYLPKNVDFIFCHGKQNKVNDSDVNKCAPKRFNKLLSDSILANDRECFML